MIVTPVTYQRVFSAEEAVAAWTAGKDSRYLAGSTEIVTMADKSGYMVNSLIDVKAIPELRHAERRPDAAGTDGWYLGAGLTLGEVEDTQAYALLSATVRHIADHTIRNRLTLGGNVCGLLPYREAVLPLLLADALVDSIVPGPLGGEPVRRTRPLRSCFDKRLSLDPGELVLGFWVPLKATKSPWCHERKTRTGPVDYPLVTVCALKNSDIAVAVTGAHPYPVLWPSTAEIRGDQRASAEYRRYLLDYCLDKIREELK